MVGGDGIIIVGCRSTITSGRAPSFSFASTSEYAIPSAFSSTPSISMVFSTRPGTSWPERPACDPGAIELTTTYHTTAQHALLSRGASKHASRRVQESGGYGTVWACARVGAWWV